MIGKKIGLVLGGGGSKGAYQLGVLLALKKHNLLDNVVAISANSIGALNLLLLVTDQLELGIKIWKEIDNSVILTKKKLSSLVTRTNFGLYSRQGLLDLLEKYIDFDKVSSYHLPLYVAASEIRKNNEVATYFQLNNKSKEEIIDYILASSAVPFVFSPVKIDGKRYNDGGRLDNEPFVPLFEYDLDCFMLIPLNDRYVIASKVFEKCPVIDFHSDIFNNLKTMASVQFSPKLSQFRLENGYITGMSFIKDLRLKGVICLSKKELKNKKNLKVELEKLYRYEI